MKPCTVIICMELSKLQCSNDDKISLKSNSLIVYSVFVCFYVFDPTFTSADKKHEN